jgi:low affinity Fe/Cu permease
MPPVARRFIQAESYNMANNRVGYEHRERFTVAQINAGATILNAVPGFKYRIIDMTMIAIGGAVTGATDVRVLGIQSAAQVALLTTLIAALTQNTLVRAGAANANILANGLSFVECDTNTPITVGKTGGNAATATHVDIILSYCLEKA